MNFNFLRKNPQYVKTHEVSDLGKRKKILIFIIIASILVLAFGGFGEKDTQKKETGEGKDITYENYIEENERRLEKILSSVSGAGVVKTMITIETAGEKVIATDKKTESSQEVENEKTSRNSSSEQRSLVFGSGSEEKPFVVKEKTPVPSGVLVVATGAGDEKVRLEIYEAVKALYGISGHRIKVAKGSIK